MNIDLYDSLEQAILSDNIDTKERLTAACLKYCNQRDINPPYSREPICFSSPSYASKCRIVPPRELPARKDFESREGLATLVHAIAHIEYSAIDLALDAVYRYREVPHAYRIDWLEVAADEIRHFRMLAQILESLGYGYGDFPVHCGLFDAAQHSAHSHLERMAIIPRYYEASGLDVSPQIMKKLQNKRNNPFVAVLLEALEVIYNEEIDHVQKGDRWFKYLCKKESKEESVYFEILDAYGLLEKHRPHINVGARKEAGFSCSEIRRLGAKECE
jgi:uncharacterized ferritin-like protein (DUF455 family)